MKGKRASARHSRGRKDEEERDRQKLQIIVYIEIVGEESGGEVERRGGGDVQQVRARWVKSVGMVAGNRRYRLWLMSDKKVWGTQRGTEGHSRKKNQINGGKGRG